MEGLLLARQADRNPVGYAYAVSIPAPSTTLK